ncbi:hypothetical protein K388_02682 [Streptomyces sp. KhCrAH-43]|nr:hypothetical protein K388_02682 [Streptomyces sp. KhCrAH-43]
MITPTSTPSMPTCSCQETARGGAIRRALRVLVVLGVLAVAVIEADPVPWDAVLNTVVMLVMRR